MYDIINIKNSACLWIWASKRIAFQYYSKSRDGVQQEGADDFMKISAFEKVVLIFTAVFVLLTVGHFLGQRVDGPYRVSTQLQWTQEVDAGTAETPAVKTDPVIEPVNINTAGVDQLQTLPGIGQYRAEQIVADREANGPFRIPEDLMRVSGIGETTLNNLIDYITVD